MATIKDIAKITGFSVTTVSRALNDHYDVSQSTKEKIRVAAKQLGYSPNMIAKSLVQKKSSTIGFIVSNLTPTSIIDNFAFNIFMGSSSQANENMYEIILIQVESSMQKDKSFKQIMHERNLDGAIIQGFDKDSVFCKEAQNSNFPVVFIDLPLQSMYSTFISSNIRQALFSAFDYLRKLGHQEIGFVHGYTKAHITDLWITNYKDYLTENNLPFANKLILNGEYSNVTTYEKSKEFLINNPTMSAVFCASDIMAIGIIKGAEELGKKIPEDFSVLGFDNILLSEYFSPPISSISQSPFDFGKNAFDMLLQIINGETNKEPLVLNTKIIERSTTGKPKRGEK